MKIISKLTDKRINALSVFLEIDYKEYMELSKDIIENNELQRKKVRKSDTVYSLLKKDIQEGGLIPPIVLAIPVEHYKLNSNSDDITESDIENIMKLNTSNLLILDGLQRTYTMLALKEELRNYHNEMEKVNNYTFRVELYLGINKFGVLYRMLTLNTGQTPMSFRHQVEIVYKDLLDVDIDGIELITEKNSRKANVLGVYKFKDVIDGLNSYLERNELPITKNDVLSNIKSLEKLSIEDEQEDIFKEFLTTYNNFIKKVDELTGNYKIEDADLEEYNVDSDPFGDNSIKVFNKSQAMTGFGAAVGKLKDRNVIKGLDEVDDNISKLEYTNDKEEWLLEMIKNLDDIRNSSKKIGNSQRLYFQHFFRSLFNPDGDGYCDLYNATKDAYSKYRIDME